MAWEFPWIAGCVRTLRMNVFMGIGIRFSCKNEESKFIENRNMTISSFSRAVCCRFIFVNSPTKSVHDNLFFIVTFSEQRGGRQFLNGPCGNSECQSIRCEQGDGCSRDLHCCRDFILYCVSRQTESFCSPLFGIFRNSIQ